MRKLFFKLSFLFFASFMCNGVGAQSKSVVIKAGTPVELQSVKTVLARDVVIM